MQTNETLNTARLCLHRLGAHITERSGIHEVWTDPVTKRSVIVHLGSMAGRVMYADNNLNMHRTRLHGMSDNAIEIMLKLALQGQLPQRMAKGVH